MSGSVNKATLVGNLGKNPEVRTMQGGGKVASFSLATFESWKDKNTGERQEKTQWHNIVIYNENLVQVAEKYLKKGMKIYVEGQMETRKWQDKDGYDKYTTEVVLRPYHGELTMLEAQKQGREASADNGSGDDMPAPHERAPAGAELSEVVF